MKVVGTRFVAVALIAMSSASSLGVLAASQPAPIVASAPTTLTDSIVGTFVEQVTKPLPRD